MQSKGNRLDSPLFLSVVALVVLGTVIVYSASSFKAQETYGDSHFYLKHHLYRVAFGFLLMFIVSRINYRVWLNMGPLLLGLSFLALLVVLISDSVPVIRGSRRWLTLGYFTFQPSDFARIALILFLSLSIGAANHITPKSGRSFAFHLGIILLMVTPIILQPDMGSALLITVIGLTILFVAGERLRYLFGLALTTVPVLLWFLQRDGYQKVRIMKFVQAIKGESVDWQPMQSFIALGNGSIFGLGLGGSRQKYHFLPDPFTDFIYAIVGEELGLIGTTLVIVLFIVLIRSGYKIAMNAPDFQGKLLGLGIVTSLSIYVVTNIGVVVNLLPTTGVPMPFLSYGGSSLLTNLFCVGILMNIAEQTRDAQSLPRSRINKSFSRRAAKQYV